MGSVFLRIVQCGRQSGERIDVVIFYAHTDLLDVLDMSVLCGDESSGPSREFYEEFSYSGAKQVIPRMHTVLGTCIQVVQ